jgi:hypothetical protein
MSPLRIQRRRVKGYRLPANTVCVDRTTRFGNLSACTRPHNCARKWCACCPHEGDSYCCVDKYKEFVDSGLENRSSYGGTLNVVLDAKEGYPYRTKLIAGLPALRGKNLACWCHLCAAHKDGKPFNVECPDCDPCHADVLGKVANQ